MMDTPCCSNFDDMHRNYVSKPIKLLCGREWKYYLMKENYYDYIQDIIIMSAYFMLNEDKRMNFYCYLIYFDLLINFD